MVLFLFLAEYAPETYPQLQGPYATGAMCAVGLVGMNSAVQFLGFYRVLLLRCALSLVLSLLMAKARSGEAVPLWPVGRSIQPLVVLRAFLGNITVILQFAALAYAPASSVMMVLSTQSIWASALCYAFMGETPSSAQVSCMGLGLVAVVLLIGSTRDMGADEAAVDQGTGPWTGLLLAAGATLTWAFSAVTIRSLCGRVHHLTLVFQLSAVGCGMCFLMAPLFTKAQADLRLFGSRVESLIIHVLAGVFCYLFTFCLNKAILLEKSGPIMLFVQGTGAVMQFIVDFAVFGVHYRGPAWLSFGVLLLYLSASFLAKSYECASGAEVSRSPILNACKELPGVRAIWHRPADTPAPAL